VEGSVQPSNAKRQRKPPITQGEINRQITDAVDSEAVLEVVSRYKKLNAVNVATALHKIAARNKKKRARRDVLFRDARFQRLIDSMTLHTSEEFVGSARSVADVMWSVATMQYWPATLLMPMLTSVNAQLEREAFEANHISTVVWALAKLECKPVKLLEKLEAQAVTQISSLDMQNVANLLWGFAKLNYQPRTLLPLLSAALSQPGALADAKPVEVADMAYAFERLCTPLEHEELLLELSSRAAPDAALTAFSSRQLVTLISALERLKATEALPEGRLDEWLEAIRAAHRETPLLAADAATLERSLARLGRDGAWIKNSELLQAWTEVSQGGERRQGRRFSDEELRAVFDSIDTDQSGDIDQAELRTAIKAIDPEADDATVAAMLSVADADGDLQVSFDEFEHIMRGGGAK